MAKKKWSIWNEVTACQYKGNKSYGIDVTGEVNIHVGFGPKNTQQLARLVTTKRVANYQGESVMVFKHSIDGVVVKMSLFKLDEKTGEAGKHIDTYSSLDSMESLSIEKIEQDNGYHE